MPTISVPYYMGTRLFGLDVPEPSVLVDPPLPEASPMRRMAALNAAVAGVVAEDDAPVVYAGDCCVIMGVLAGLQRRGRDPYLVFFDAHGDFNTWETTPSGFIGGMPLAMAVGRGEQTIVAGAGMRVLSEDRVALVGARDLDPGEDDAVATSDLAVLSVEGVTGWSPPPGPLYVHVDVDVVDPQEMPAINYPAPGGPSLATTAAALQSLAATGRVAAFSVSSWNPGLEGADVAAAATRQLAAPFLPGDVT